MECCAAASIRDGIQQDPRGSRPHGTDPTPHFRKVGEAVGQGSAPVRASAGGSTKSPTPIPNSPTKMKINTGINEADRENIAAGLSRLLADSYTLYLQTHNFHWNVTGPMFQTLHVMFEAHYTELALAVDVIAERIRALGMHAPGTYSEFISLSSIQEVQGVPKATEMIGLLVNGHEAVVRTARSIFPVVEMASDEASADLLTQRIQLHEKTAWMLRSLLEG